MKLKIVYFVWFSGLLFAILAAVIHEGERVVRTLGALPDRDEVQDVRVVNSNDDAVPVAIQRSESSQDTPAAILMRRRVDSAVKAWPRTSSSSGH